MFLNFQFIISLQVTKFVCFHFIILFAKNFYCSFSLYQIPKQSYKTKKYATNITFNSVRIIFFWRKVGDSNPRRLAPYRFSRATRSTTPTTLHILFKLNRVIEQKWVPKKSLANF